MTGVLPANVFLLAAGFSSTWMLLWSLSAAVPLALHFWARRHQKTTPWAAVHILRLVIEKQSRRLRVEQIILLVVRTLIPILLAVALARPFFTPALDTTGQTPANQRRFWAIAIDTSQSMSYEMQEGVTLLDFAKKQASEIVRNAGVNDMFVLVAMRSPPDAIVAIPTIDKQSVLAAIDSLSVSYTGMNLEAGLDLIEDLAGRASGEAFAGETVVHIYSDLGLDTWSGGPEMIERLTGFTSRLDVSIHPILSDDPVNAALVEITLPAGPLLQGTRGEIAVRIEQFGSPNDLSRNRKLQVLLDDRVVASRPVSLAAGASQTVPVSVPWENSGPQVLSARLDKDRMPIDDTRSIAIEVTDSSKILIVEQRRGSALPIEVAIESELRSEEAIESTTVSAVELSTVDLSQWDVVVLHDVASISATQARSLALAVQSGTGLVLLHGKQTIPAAWNAALERAPEFVGYKLGGVTDEGSWTIDPLDYKSPIVSPFEGYPESGLLTSSFFGCWKVTDVAATVDAALTNGQPLILSSDFGQGRVVSFLSAPEGTPQELFDETAIGASQPWNVLASWPSFLPLMQQVIDYSQGQTATRTVEVGQPIRGFASLESSLSRTIQVQRPDGDADTLTISREDRQLAQPWTYGRTDQPGTYSAKLSETQEQAFVANISLAESSLAAVDPVSLPVEEEPSRLSVAASAKTTEALPASDSIWRWLILAVVCLLCSESLLAWWFGRRVG